MGRSDNTEKELKGERVVGAGKGPVRQLDVVAEVSFFVVFILFRSLSMINIKNQKQQLNARMLSI